MLYCEKCMLLTEGPRCVRCNGRRLREVAAGDFCMVDEYQGMWAHMVCDVLEQSGIPCVSRSVLGAGLAMSVGLNLDRQMVFVPYERLSEAREIARALFDGGEPEGLTE